MKTQDLLSTFICNIQQCCHNQVVQCIPSVYVSYNWEFVPFVSLHLIVPPLTTSHTFLLCIYAFAYFDI